MEILKECYRERRRFPRLNKSLPMRYQVRGGKEFSYRETENISAGGLSFIEHKFIAPQTNLMLEIKLLERSLKPIGKVSWISHIPHTDSFKIGVEFLEFDPEDKKFLNDYIELMQKML